MTAWKTTGALAIAAAAALILAPTLLRQVRTTPTIAVPLQQPIQTVNTGEVQSIIPEVIPVAPVAEVAPAVWKQRPIRPPLDKGWIAEVEADLEHPKPAVPTPHDTFFQDGCPACGMG